MSDCRIDGYCDPETGKYHWKPDQKLSTELYYGFDFTDWLTAEGDTRVAVVYTVPDELTNMAEAINGEIYYVKLSADTVGTHEVSCTLTSIEGAATQKQTKSAFLTII